MKNDWCYAVVGNIKKTRIDENGVLRYGTAAFRGNTRVYLQGRNWDERFPDSRDIKEIEVIGFSRDKRFICTSVPFELIENVRLTRIYSPTVLDMMAYFEFSEYWWWNTSEDRADAVRFLERWRRWNGN